MGDSSPPLVQARQHSEFPCLAHPGAGLKAGEQADPSMPVAVLASLGGEFWCAVMYCSKAKAGWTVMFSMLWVALS